MRTLVLSDLHLGSRTDADVLRRPEARAALFAGLAADPPDRLVLLGDTLELRHGPVADALDAARPFVEGLGEALPDATEVVLLAGNHDHALVAPWLARRSLERQGPLGLEERGGADASEATATIGRWLGGDRLDVAYPGIWLREDVYALHGHYLDRHVTVPTFERLAAGAMERVAGALPRGRGAAGPDDYEAALAPLYAWFDVVARHAGRDPVGFGADRQRGTQDAWRTLTDGARTWRGRAFAAAFPVAVWGVNRLGLGPVGSRLSPEDLRRAGTAAIADTARSLGVDAAWLVYGHTHRAGPLDLDRDAGPVRMAEWEPPGAPKLVNTGCWVHEEVFLGQAGRRSPYWPGTVVEVDADPGTAPRHRNLLPDFSP